MSSVNNHHNWSKTEKGHVRFQSESSTIPGHSPVTMAAPEDEELISKFHFQFSRYHDLPLSIETLDSKVKIVPPRSTHSLPLGLGEQLSVLYLPATTTFPFPGWCHTTLSAEGPLSATPLGSLYVDPQPHMVAWQRGASQQQHLVLEIRRKGSAKAPRASRLRPARVPGHYTVL